MPKIPKCVFKKEFHNPNYRATSIYSTVEYFSQTPCAMSALEVLQSCPAQQGSLLEALGKMYSSSLLANFNLSYIKLLLPYQVALSVDVVHGSKTIGRTFVDEGASTCVMSIYCWKALGSPKLVPSNTLLTTFDERYFHPHGILPAFEIKLEGKLVAVEVEVIDALVDYNFSLG